MNQALSHRGPDGEGVWSDAHACLGHRRLSIIDLSSNGAQPMVCNLGRYVVVCNGEIYNFRGLKRDLLEGYNFKSRTDVEILLPLFMKFGVHCVDHLVGMFAFAIWDRHERKLHLFRDRFGEKPLYYVERDGLFAFASEVNALLTLPWVERVLDEEAVANMFVYQSVPAPLTFYKGVRALPPASRLTWDMNRVEVSQYWNLVFEPNHKRKNHATLAEYEFLVERAVQGCLVADVPLGLMLSGGVDSSTVAALAVRNHADIKSYCVGVELPDGIDPEISRAREVALHIGTDHAETFFKLNELSRLPHIIAQYGQPINCPACLYAAPLAQQMSEKATVILTGNGADEIFAGYRNYQELPGVDRKRTMARAVPRGLARWIPGAMGNRINEFLLYANTPLGKWRSSGLDQAGVLLSERMATDGFRERWKDYSPGMHIEKHVRDSGATSLLQAVLYSDLMVCHNHGHGTISDIAGMNCSLEYRSPFLDHRLVEFSGTLSKDMLVPSVTNPQMNKFIMKEYLAKTLPRELVFAPKMGFGYSIDLFEYIKGKWRKPLRKQVLEGNYLSLGIFTREGAEWALEHSLGTAWMVIAFSVWADINLFGNTPDMVSERLMKQMG